MLYHLNNIYKELSIFYILIGGKGWFEKKNIMASRFVNPPLWDEKNEEFYLWLHEAKA